MQQRPRGGWELIGWEVDFTLGTTDTYRIGVVDGYASTHTYVRIEEPPIVEETTYPYSFLGYSLGICMYACIAVSGLLFLRSLLKRS